MLGDMYLYYADMYLYYANMYLYYADMYLYYADNTLTKYQDTTKRPKTMKTHKKYNNKRTI